MPHSPKQRAPSRPLEPCIGATTTSAVVVAGQKASQAPVERHDEMMPALDDHILAIFVNVVALKAPTLASPT